MKKILILISIFFVLNITACFALEATPNSVEVSFGIQEYLILEIDTHSVDFETVNPENSPFQKDAATNMAIKSNADDNWELHVYASGDLISQEDSGESIPLSQLEYKGGDVTSFTSFLTSPATIWTGVTGTDNITIDYRLTITYNDAAANSYQTAVTYEIVKQ
ncbi:MAG: hypothetical protein ABIH39_08045 [Candidatus Margulisiibacteriota bacterium]